MNGLVVGKTPKSSVHQKMRTYFGEIHILATTANISVASNWITINDKHFRWKTFRRVSIDGATVEISSKRNVTIQVGEGLVFTVLRHKVKKPHPTKVDFLGFYVKDGTALSTQTHGLIGNYILYHLKQNNII